MRPNANALLSSRPSSVAFTRRHYRKQLWWNWQLDESRYSEWPALRAELARDGIRILTYVNPFLVDVSGRSSARRNLFEEAVQRGFLVKNRTGQPYLIPNTDFSAGLIDLTNPDAQAFYKAILRDEVLSIGASGWMADFGEALPYDAQLYSKEPAPRFHNRYSESWAALNREVIESSGKGDELVFFMRSGYRQSPRHATLFWLGDQLVSWDAHDGIKTAVIGLLAGGLSGYSLNHSDIGGYTTVTSPIKNYHRSRELLWRWMELGAFQVVFRTHEGNQPEHNHQFDSDEETLQQFGRCARLYVAWAEYRKKLVQEAADTGMPVARHLFLHHPHDPIAQRLTYEEYLIGSEILFAPVLDLGTKRVRAYLPAGNWIHLWSKRRFLAGAQGTTAEVDAPFGHPAVFYRADSADGELFARRVRELGLL